MVRKAIAWGLDPVTAIQMATINTAEYFRPAERGRGGPRLPGRPAGAGRSGDGAGGPGLCRRRAGGRGGQLPALRRRPVPGADPAQRPRRRRPPSISPSPAGEGPARVIGVIPEQIVTEDLRLEPTTENGYVVSDPARDLLKMAVVERHHGTGNVGLGLVKGVGLKRGAIASSVAHDSHNIVVIGASDDEMRAAVAAIVEMGGGQVVVADGEVLAACPLPIAGLMSDRPLEEVRDQVEALTEAAHALGCTLPDPLMTMSFLALPVIPSPQAHRQGPGGREQV